MNILGIDNGLDGGFVILDESGFPIRRHVMPTIDPKAGKGKRQYDIPRIVQLLSSDIRIGYAYLERAQAMPKQGVSSTFSIGVGYGIWQGVLTALGIPFTIVAPRTWQGKMFFGINSRDTKQASAIVAGRLASTVDWRKTANCKKAHDGLTDAFCIARYGWMERTLRDK